MTEDEFVILHDKKNYNRNDLFIEAFKINPDDPRVLNSLAETEEDHEVKEKMMMLCFKNSGDSSSLHYYLGPDYSMANCTYYEKMSNLIDILNSFFIGLDDKAKIAL